MYSLKLSKEHAYAVLAALFEQMMQAHKIGYSHTGEGIIYGDAVEAADRILATERNEVSDKLASALAHRVCCGTEHDPSQGKLHGYCVVCGVEWPCETAKKFLATERTGVNGKPHVHLYDTIKFSFDRHR